MYRTICLGAKVLTLFGHNIGSVAYLVGEGRSNRLTHLVIRRNGATARVQVVPLERVHHFLCHGQTLQLALTREEIDYQPELVEQLQPDRQRWAFINGTGNWQEKVAEDLLAYDFPQNSDGFYRCNLPQGAFLVGNGEDQDRTEAVSKGLKRVIFNSRTGKMTGVCLENGRVESEELVLPFETIHEATDEVLSRMFTEEAFMNGIISYQHRLGIR